MVAQNDIHNAGEKLLMFSKILRITKTDLLLQQYDLSELQDLSKLGATLIIKLYTDIPMSEKLPSEYLFKIGTNDQYRCL